MLLKNSWFTEIQLNFTERHPEFMAYSNHWGCVQLYYSIYLSFRALFTARNLSTTGYHADNLKQLSDEITRCPELFPYPWKITCIGDPGKPSFTNMPQNISVVNISCLASNPDFFGSYTKFLKTTRKRLIEKRISKKKRNNKKVKISSEEKNKIIEGLYPTTFFDCIYRLRERANYEDVESFLITLENKDWANSFNYSLRNILGNTLQLIELLILGCMGRKKFFSIVDKFLSSEKHNSESIKKRHDLLRDLT